MPVHPISAGALRGALRAGSVGVVGALALTLLAPAAHADPVVTVTSTVTATVRPDATTTLAGVAVDAGDPQQTLEVTVSTDVGTLALTTTTGLVLAFGNSWSGTSSITFTGLEDDINDGLATAALTTGDDAGQTAHIGVTALASAPGFVYSPTNGHFYEYVAASAITQPDAATAAASQTFQGQDGYLASIPSADVNDLITSRIEGAINVWIGTESVDTPGDPVQRTWQWAYGPLTGEPVSYCANFTEVCDFSTNDGLYSSWQTGEPNNGAGTEGEPYSGEWVAVTNWGAANGRWNDLPPDVGGAIDGYVVEYGDLADSASSFDGVDTASAAVLIADAPVSTTPSGPLGLTGVGGDRTLTLTWAPPVDIGSSAISGYAVSLDNGRSWTAARTTGTTRLHTTVPGVRKATTVPVRVRAANASGAGAASLRVDVAIPQWFADPVSDAARADEVAVPRHPKRYHGKLRHTVATARSRDGLPAYPAKTLAGRQLQSGEAVSLLSRRMFKFNQTRLLPAGRRALRATVASLTYVDAVTCEGYADYGGRTAWERTLARKRAQTVCARLRAYGADVNVRPVGYGSSRPMVIGGSRSDRSANRRVVIVVTSG